MFSFFKHANVTLPKGEASAAMVAPAAIPVVPVAQSADDVAADQGFQCTAVLRLYLLLQPEQRSCHGRRCGACMSATEVKPLVVAARYCCRPGCAAMFFCDGRPAQ